MIEADWLEPLALRAFIVDPETNRQAYELYDEKYRFPTDGLYLSGIFVYTSCQLFVNDIVPSNILSTHTLLHLYAVIFSEDVFTKVTELFEFYVIDKTLWL